MLHQVQGFLPTVLEDVPDMAVKFAVYEMMRGVHMKLQVGSRSGGLSGLAPAGYCKPDGGCGVMRGVHMRRWPLTRPRPTHTAPAAERPPRQRGGRPDYGRRGGRSSSSSHHPAGCAEDGEI